MSKDYQMQFVIDQVVQSIFERALKSMTDQLAEHARQRGASEEWLAKVRQQPDHIAYNVLALIYGELPRPPTSIETANTGISE